MHCINTVTSTHFQPPIQPHLQKQMVSRVGMLREFWLREETLVLKN